jgi:molybdopterin/thiamine biosynthesis adenylyltransferase
MLNDSEKRRYARQLLIPEVGEVGQEKLLAAKVLVIGAGGLGAASLSYLAAMGIGNIGIMDADYVEISNLNRQIIHETGDIGRAKVESAADRISELNPSIKITKYQSNFSESNAEIVQHYDLIIDGVDNFASRYIINDACLKYGKAWIYAAVRGLGGQLATFQPQPSQPCYRCFVPNTPHGRNDCAERGILGAVVGVMGAMQAVDAVKYLLGLNEPQTHLLRYDGLKAEWKKSKLIKDLQCKTCGKL